MYKIDAFIRADRLDHVKQALVSQGFDDFTVAEVRSHSSTYETRCYRGVASPIEFVPRLHVELHVSEDGLYVARDCIANAASTGSLDDGKIVVTELADAFSIRQSHRSSTVTQRAAHSY